MSRRETQAPPVAPLGGAGGVIFAQVAIEALRAVHAPHGPNDVVTVVDPYQHVNLGNILQQALAIALHQAAGDDDVFQSAAPFPFGQFGDNLERLVARRPQEPAGVYDDRVGRGLVSADHRPTLRKLSQHRFRINQVLGTPQRHQGNHGRILEIKRRSGTLLPKNWKRRVRLSGCR